MRPQNNYWQSTNKTQPKQRVILTSKKEPSPSSSPSSSVTRWVVQDLPERVPFNQNAVGHLWLLQVLQHVAGDLLVVQNLSSTRVLHGAGDVVDNLGGVVGHSGRDTPPLSLSQRGIFLVDWLQWRSHTCSRRESKQRQIFSLVSQKIIKIIHHNTSAWMHYTQFAFHSGFFSSQWLIRNLLLCPAKPPICPLNQSPGM